LRGLLAALESNKSIRKSEQIRDFILALAFTAGPFGFGVPLIYSCISWAVAWISLGHFFWNLDFCSVVTTKRKVGAAGIISAILVLLVRAPIHTAFIKERSSALTGDLVAESDGQDHSSDLPVLQIGNNKFTWAGAPGKPSFTHDTPDFADRIITEMVKGRVQLSTTIRTKDGSLIVDIVRNHWTVSSSRAICWDKNYSNDRLEVKDGRGRVVLQVRVLPTVVQLQAELDEEAGKNGGIFIDGQYSVKDGITPAFEYPSELYWGKLVAASQ
jgi:hypothetical protein